MARKNLKTAPAAVPSAREVLAEAIERGRAIEADIANIHAAIEKAEGVWRAARLRAESADAAIEQAKASAADHAVAVAMGEKRKAPVSVKAARQAATEAADDMDAAAATVTALRARLTAEERFTHTPRIAVEAAAAEVVKVAPETQSLLERVEALQRDLANAGAALLMLHSMKALDTVRVEVDGVLEFSRAERAVHRLTSPLTSWRELLSGAALPDKWRAALERLKADANAELPA